MAFVPMFVSILPVLLFRVQFFLYSTHPDAQLRSRRNIHHRKDLPQGSGDVFRPGKLDLLGRIRKAFFQTYQTGGKLIGIDHRK